MDKKLKLKVLIIDDEKHAQLANERVVNKLCEKHFKIKPLVSVASNLVEIKSALSNDEFNLVLLDKDLGTTDESEPIDGLDQISLILEAQPHARVIMVTGYKDSKLAVKAIEEGATDFITKPETDEERRYRDTRILKALRDSHFELESLRRNYYPEAAGGDFVYKSQAMKLLDIKLQQLAEVSTPVLILGESGLGKTHTAKRLRDLTRSIKKQEKRPFANININALSDTLLLSELFGHEKGAFTGANETKKGLFEICRNGDLFLDEIGDASPAIQGALLKVICEKEFTRVGGRIPIKTNARLIFATNQDLEALMNSGQFRPELYGRICTAKIQMPELKERKEDIPYICQNITDLLKKENNKNISYSDFPIGLKKYFLRDDIPFNIRGIRSDLERVMIYSPVKPNRKLDYKDWRKTLASENASLSLKKENVVDLLMDRLVDRMGKEDWTDLMDIKAQLEEKAVARVQEQFPTNKTRAQMLGISEAAASVKLKKYSAKYKLDGKL